MRKATWTQAMSICFGALCASCTSCAQQIDHYTPEPLMEQAMPLQEKAAAANGAAAVTLQKYCVA